MIDIFEAIRENQEVFIVGMAAGLLVAGLTVLMAAFQLQYVGLLPVNGVGGVETILDPTPPSLWAAAAALLILAFFIFACYIFSKRQYPGVGADEEIEQQNE